MKQASSGELDRDSTISTSEDQCPMSLSLFGVRFDRFFGASRSLLRPRTRRIRTCFHPRGETLEGRALLATVTVQLMNLAFSPPTSTIHVGDTVHWVWNESNHSMTSVGGIAESWNSGVHNVPFTF